MATVSAALAHATKLFSASDSAELDAQLLLAHVLGKTRTWLYTWPDYELTAPEHDQFQTLCKQRAKGQPVAYLLGRREFWTFDLFVTPAVLIPRPETELLVELALQTITKPTAKVVDLGTGSGAVALALAKERPGWQVIATEFHSDAMAVAARNAQHFNLPNLNLLSGNWCEPLPDSDYDLFVSNPPYIDAEDQHIQQGDLRFEPMTALISADAGLADIKLIAQQAHHKLASGGHLMLEHGWQQGNAVKNILRELGYTHVETCVDHGGRDRVTIGRKSVDQYER